MKILNSADWHINLRKKKIPKNWQINRFNQLFKKLFELEKECDIHILAGDIFDQAPNLEEVCLFNYFLNNITIPTYIIPGNHEATRKGHSFLENYLKHESINNPNIYIFTKNERVEIQGQYFQFFPYGEMQLDHLPPKGEGDILVTHIRGEVPPHVTPEYNFEKLRHWKLILLGDLHFNHQYKDYPAYYPGSPLNVIFDRDENRSYGINIIDFNSIEDYKVNFIDLNLPKLIRKTIKAGEQLTPDNIHHVVYEITGSIDELSQVENNVLIDKKIAHKPEEGSSLDLSKKGSLIEELRSYLDYIKVEDIEAIIKEFLSLNVDMQQNGH